MARTADLLPGIGRQPNPSETSQTSFKFRAAGTTESKLESRPTTTHEAEPATGSTDGLSIGEMVRGGVTGIQPAGGPPSLCRNPWRRRDHSFAETGKQNISCQPASPNFADVEAVAARRRLQPRNRATYVTGDAATALGGFPQRQSTSQLAMRYVIARRVRSQPRPDRDEGEMNLQLSGR